MGIDRKITQSSIIENVFSKFGESSADFLDQENNLFPVDTFPSPFKELITGGKEAFNFPTEFTGLSILSAVSTAIGKSAKICVKKGWYEFPSFYMGIIGNPGTNKSHPLDMAHKPLESIDKVQIDLFKKEYEAYDQYNKLPMKERDNLLKPNYPVLKKIILHNYTPEILSQRLADNDRGCSLLSDELATFLEGMNNYSKGDQASTYTSIWSNKSTSIDRIKNPVPIVVSHPFLNIIGGIQPKVLPKLFPENKSDIGLLQRFLWAWPDNSKKYPINDVEMNESIEGNYNRWIKDYIIATPIIINPITELPQANIYYWTDEAKEFFYTWQAENSDLCNKNANSILGEIISKFDIHFVRLALVLQIMNDYKTNEISLQSAQGAAKMCNYFLYNAQKVLNILTKSSNPEDILTLNKLQFYNALPKEFETSEALIIGRSHSLMDRCIKKFLQDKRFFEKQKHGSYKKLN
jgi:hypothetical protein